MGIKKCSNCDYENSTGDSYCYKCGSKLDSNFINSEYTEIENINFNEKNDSAVTNPFFIFGSIVIILFLIIFGINTEWGSVLIILGFIGLSALVIVILFDIQNDKNKQKAIANQKKELNNFYKQYQKIKYGIDIPESAKTIVYLKSSIYSPIKISKKNTLIYIWKNNDTINFFPLGPKTNPSLELHNFKLSQIPIEKIEFFHKEGELYRETKITGGGGGGSTIGGAVVGGLIAGDTGAIIGSRKKVDEIRSELITHDERKTILNFFDDDNERYSIQFDNESFQILNDLIPEKEYNIVNALKSKDILNKVDAMNKNKSIVEQLHEIKQLLDEDILTEQEFNEMKKRILGIQS
ncbi:MAG: hypothetical protein Q7U53_17285 [Anaerolineaceae bacterium]|nr:hypothetical protein [Anaerolineaceae bacterium]